MSLTDFRLTRRIAFFFSMRRVSLLETNQRLSRMELKMPLLIIFLRKRLSSESCDSPLRKCTEANEITYFPNQVLRLKISSAVLQTQPRINDKRNGKPDHTINRRSHSFMSQNYIS